MLRDSWNDGGIERLIIGRKLALVVEDAHVTAVTTADLARVIRASVSAKLLSVSVIVLAGWRHVSAPTFSLIFSCSKSVIGTGARVDTGIVFVETAAVDVDRHESRRLVLVASKVEVLRASIIRIDRSHLL